MAEKKKSRLKWVLNKYRLVVLNNDTFEEKFSLKLAPLNVFVLLGFSTIVLIFLVASLIAFTPIRAYLPGYADEVKMRRQMMQLSLTTDSLEHELKLQNEYNDNIRNILSGNLVKDSIGNKMNASAKYKNAETNPSLNEADLRHKVEEQEKYNLMPTHTGSNNLVPKSSISNFFFFTPVRGYITASFDAGKEHFGIDVAAKENESIKATLDGTVISAGWTSDNGHVIQVQHDNNIISIYKHNSSLLKKTGQYVKAGEAIAIIGNSGELTTGPHLHFELWYNGKPVDPQEYMAF